LTDPSRARDAASLRRRASVANVRNAALACGPRTCVQNTRLTSCIQQRVRIYLSIHLSIYLSAASLRRRASIANRLNAALACGPRTCVQNTRLTSCISNGSVSVYLSFHLSIYLSICRLPTPPRLERESSKRSPRLRPTPLRAEYAAHELYRATGSYLSIYPSIYLSIYLSAASLRRRASIANRLNAALACGPRTCVQNTRLTSCIEQRVRIYLSIFSSFDLSIYLPPPYATAPRTRIV